MFPFAGVVGAEDAKLALVLAALDPAIGGVLLRGEKGSAKTTLARGFAALLPGEARFVELPIGATEDRVIGSLDLQSALTGGQVQLRPGLLADADGGVLYVDEVNLLPDHLVDAILDVAVSGINRVEREGIAASHPARFVLVGSMNPEEGELRPQFLDRFGLAADVRAPADLDDRAEAVTRRLGFDAGVTNDRWSADDARLAARVAAAAASPPATLPTELIRAVGALCLAVGAQGLRADLVICRGAAALARWEGRFEANEADVRRVAPMALAHRARRNPFDDHGIDEEQLGAALDDALDSAPADGPDLVAPPADPAPVRRIEGAGPRRGAIPPPAGRRASAEGSSRGRLVGDRLPGAGELSSIAVAATVREAAVRRVADADGPLVAPGDLRQAVRQQRTGNLIVLAVDASGSMGADRRMEAAKGAVLGLLTDAYERRDRVALVTFRGDRADVALRPTGSIEVAQSRLSELPTGGRTPLGAGILTGLHVAVGGRPSGYPPLLVVVTDGRATAAPDGEDPVEVASRAAHKVKQAGVASIVVDVEHGPSRLGLAAALAEAMGAQLLTLGELTGSALRAAVQAARP